MLYTVGSPVIAGVFVATTLAVGAITALVPGRSGTAALPSAPTDWSLVRDATADVASAVAITDRGGRSVCTNARYDNWFGTRDPTDLDGARQRLAPAARAAWRDGSAHASIDHDGASFDVEVVRAGIAEDCLVWRLAKSSAATAPDTIVRALIGEWGDRLGQAGVMVALVDGDGTISAATRAFHKRATGRADGPDVTVDFASLLSSDAGGGIRFVAEGADATPLRLLQMPLDEGRDDSHRLVMLLDAGGGETSGAARDVSLQMLLQMLPLGLALADRDGRFLYLNEAFGRIAGVAAGSVPTYPGDLVIREDKTAVADAVRRFASAQNTSGDIAVRLLGRPDETVALTVAGTRGLGEAAVLLSLKDNSEESKLQRQVAQATKMQAVGQLAGGVAHDFNNILTAILGACDLMLMRHTPGDSDYDDIQQIRNNSNRAAALTRQLLAFSRQQTLRPQIVQLPDVVSEVSNLLGRLIGDTVDLVINHGRALGPVRADPGQLEQVIVNLSLNARDAMPGGGTLTLRTYAVTADEVRALDTEILPVGAYTALSVADTGTGIAPEIVSKIFEPFFTTKEVGKGTGLGLSTVYGIVKQSGGFIFADSKLGKGTTFVIYLPVHASASEPAPVVAPKKPERASELWGSATVLVVEDEDMVRAVAERALARHGYTVLTAANGEEAMRVLDAHAVDLLVSDVVMPTMDGPTLGREARARWPDLPILFMSGYAEEQLRRTIDLPRMGFLPKPFSVKALAEAARDTLALQ